MSATSAAMIESRITASATSTPASTSRIANEAHINRLRIFSVMLPNGNKVVKRRLSIRNRPISASKKTITKAAISDARRVSVT